MDIQLIDFNDAANAFTGQFLPQWANIEAALKNTPIQLKASDQAGKQGTLIFDPVGTNAAIKYHLVNSGWNPNVPLPNHFSFLGTDVDFVGNGVIIEAQFSNYPFLLNNVLRSELLYKSKVPMAGREVKALVVITKAHMFPASNSTLYYEQAMQQLSELAKHEVFDVPIRLVGLFSPVGLSKATFTSYHNARYSRTIRNQEIVTVNIARGHNARSRCRVTLA